MNLIACLYPDESRLMQKELKKHRRTALLPLFNRLKKAVKKNQELSNEELFPLISDKPYQKKWDYLLRNELRLLNGEIETFLLSNEVMKQLKTDNVQEINPSLLWLKLLLERQQFGLFEKEWRKMERQANEQQNFRLLSQLSPLYFEYIRKYQEIHPQLYQETRPLLEAAKEWTLKAALENFRQLEVKTAYLDRVLYAFDTSYPRKALVQKVVLPANPIEPLFEYLYLWGLTYIEEKNTDHFLKLLEIHPEVVKTRPEYERQEVIFHSRLALEYMLRKEHQQADFYYKESLRLHQQYHDTIDLNLLFNYFSNLCKMHHFEEAIKLWEKHQTAIDENPKLRYRYRYLAAMCYLFQNRPTLATALLPEDIHKRPQNDYYYSRFILAISYYLEDMDDVFEREIQNIYQSIQYKTPEEVVWVDNIRMFRKFMRIYLYTADEGEKKEKLQELAQQIEQDMENGEEYTDHLPLEWLYGECR